MFVYYERRRKNVLVNFIRVDDTLLCGKRDAINESKTKVKEQFNIKELRQLKNTWVSGTNGSWIKEEK